jgi:hypothetical protein
MRAPATHVFALNALVGLLVAALKVAATPGCRTWRKGRPEHASSPRPTTRAAEVLRPMPATDEPTRASLLDAMVNHPDLSGRACAFDLLLRAGHEPAIRAATSRLGQACVNPAVTARIAELRAGLAKGTITEAEIVDWSGSDGPAAKPRCRLVRAPYQLKCPETLQQPAPASHPAAPVR